MRGIIRLVGFLVFVVGATGLLESRRNNPGHRTSRSNLRRDGGRSFDSNHYRSTRRAMLESRTGDQFKPQQRRKATHSLHSRPTNNSKSHLAGGSSRPDLSPVAVNSSPTEMQPQFQKPRPIDSDQEGLAAAPSRPVSVADEDLNSEIFDMPRKGIRRREK